MIDKKKIAPDEVKVITEVKTLYRAEGHSEYYLKEEDCRNNAATSGRCTICGEHTARNGWTICDACRTKRDHEEHMAKLVASPEWNGSYPVCLGDDFFFDEDEFLDHIVLHDIYPDDIDDLYACTPIYAKDTIDKDDLIRMVQEEMGGEEPECSGNIEAAIDEFIVKLEAVKEPISYVGNKLVRLTTEQIMMISKTKAEEK